MRARVFAVALLFSVGAVPVMAQQKGTIEIGVFNKYTHFDKSYGPLRSEDYFEGGGLHFGWFATPKWELEFTGSVNENDPEAFFKGTGAVLLYYLPFHLRLNWNQRLGSNSPFTFLLGAGPGYNRYSSGTTSGPSFKGSDWGVSGLAGLRFRLKEWLALRVDGTVDYIPTPNNGKAALVGQGQGITAASPAKHNTNLGGQFGLSLFLGTCNRNKDGTTVSPSTATVATGGTASFSATSTNCGKPDDAIFTVSGPGSVSTTGVFTATTAGTASVTACGRQNKLCSSASVTVTPPPPPPPPPRVLARCELSPPTSNPRIDQPVSYTVTLFYSDGTSEPMANPAISAPGGSVTGTSVSWSAPGSKTVTVTCGNGAGGAAVNGTATADVQQLAIVVRDSVYFNSGKTIIYRTEDQGSLGEIARVLLDHPDIRLIIDGHTDADGTVKSNDALGMRRAQAMKAYLASRGVPVDRMTIVLRSFGECVPLAPNATEQGRSQNRRAELKEFGNVQPEAANAACAEAGRERKP